MLPPRIDGEGEIAAEPVRAKRSVEICVEASGDPHAEMQVAGIDEILEAVCAPLVVARHDYI
jgi:hypothetical protein